MIEALQSLSGTDLMVGGFALVIVVGAMGLVAQTILRDAGFGTVVNGLLVIVGAVAGATLRAVTFGFQ